MNGMMMDTEEQLDDSSSARNLMSRKEAAEYLGYSPRFLACLEEYIPFSKIGSAFVYCQEDLDGFISSHMSRKEAAEYLGCSTRWLAIMEPYIPPFRKIGNGFIYRISDLSDFIVQHMDTVTTLVFKGKRI